MYTFFNYAKAPFRGRVNFPDFIYVRNGLQREKTKTITYYRNFPRFIPSNHLLVKLIDSINVPYNDDIRIHYDKVQDIALNLSMALKMTSSLYRGKVFSPGVFYGKQSNEIIIATDDEFSGTDGEPKWIDSIETNWRDLEPIRVIHHEYTNLNMDIPFGPAPETKNALAVIIVNIPMLSCQYQQWRKELNSKREAGSALGVGQFLYAYPLANMINSHLDYSLFNRLSAIWKNDDIPPYRNNQSFFVVNYSERVDRLMAFVLNNLKSKQTDFPNLLMTIPAASEESMFNVLHLPKVVPTRQIDWALDVARLNAISFLLEFNRVTDNRRNNHYVTNMRIALRQLENDSVLRTALPNNILLDIERFIFTRIKPFM